MFVSLMRKFPSGNGFGEKMKVVVQQQSWEGLKELVRLKVSPPSTVSSTHELLPNLQEGTTQPG